MALSIKDHDTEQLARTLAQRTGESITLEQILLNPGHILRL